MVYQKSSILIKEENLNLDSGKNYAKFSKSKKKLTLLTPHGKIKLKDGIELSMQ